MILLAIIFIVSMAVIFHAFGKLEDKEKEKEQDK